MNAYAPQQLQMTREQQRRFRRLNPNHVGPLPLREIEVGRRQVEVGRNNQGRMRYRNEPIYAPVFPPDVNNNMKYIFVCIDHFSGKVWARPIRNRENKEPPNATLANALYEIMQEANTTPHIIQADSEFDKGSFKTYCEQTARPPIRLIKTASYTPTSNGKVERVNREIRKKIKAGFIQHNNLRWTAFLQDYIDNINGQQSSINHMTPNQIWTEGYNPPAANQPVPVLPNQPRFYKPPDNTGEHGRKSYNEAVINKRAELILAEGRNPPHFRVGDLVRIKMLNFSNLQRKAMKEKIGWNKIAVHYSPKIYEVNNVTPATPVEREKYTLRVHPNGPIVRLSRGNNAPAKLFYGTELIGVPNPNEQTNIDPRTKQRAEWINRLTRNWVHVH
jgi:hypothetical protein